MAIEGLKNIYNIPSVKKEREIDTNQERKQKKDPKKRKKTEEERQPVKEGHIDIRI